MMYKSNKEPRWEDYGAYSTTGSGEGWKDTKAGCGCDEDKKWPKPNINCICNKPLLLYVPPGQHVHLNCPVHGDFIVSGGPVVWM